MNLPIRPVPAVLIFGFGIASIWWTPGLLVAGLCFFWEQSYRLDQCTAEVAKLRVRAERLESMVEKRSEEIRLLDRRLQSPEEREKADAEKAALDEQARNAALDYFRHTQPRAIPDPGSSVPGSEP